MSGRLVGNIVIQAIMKKILLFVTILMTSCPIFAQSIPPLVRYEPVIVDRNGNVVDRFEPVLTVKDYKDEILKYLE